ncbi:hypothetical protein PHJA_000640500 [Phtheirospermum japonicum]|uniref:Hydroxyproline O-arabinosyltransferase-like domain-containing protein n=1 Tax=Phtheirospermum japonicum TaxID=374723 RepID=A0A830BCX4_9LAMI|nr:hypothetical protein PHJA_000640500 [Phtheirospermum japonicum]
MAMGKLLSAVLGLALAGLLMGGVSGQEPGREVVAGTAPYRIHTLFSVECQNYFDWETVGLMHSFRKAKQPGPITRLLSCTDEERKDYKGMDLAPTLEVPSMSRHPKTGDWYPAINKPAGVVHWLQHSKDAENVDWVVILDADMIIRGPIIPWELGAEKGKPVAAYYGYLVGCDNVLAKCTRSTLNCVTRWGGLLAMHIDDLRALAPKWLSKTEEVREDRDHWATNYTGDIYGTGWISEMYGYSFGAAEVGLRHKITDNLMIYPGYTPARTSSPFLCTMACLLALEIAHGCPKPKWSKYLSFLRSKRFAELTQPKLLTPESRQMMEVEEEKKQDVVGEPEKWHPKIHTIFSTECTPYFDWQTVGLVHSFHQSGQPGEITRLMSCTDEDLKEYKGHDLAPTHYVPSMSRHPLTGDW